MNLLDTATKGWGGGLLIGLGAADRSGCDPEGGRAGPPAV